MRLRSRKHFFVFLFLGLSVLAFAQLVPEKPKIIYPVTDNVGLLTATEKENLNQKLIKYNDSTSTEIAVIIVPTTSGEDINYLATMYGEKWGIGEKEQDNGIVFLIATEDRKFAIQQGRGVERYLTASVAGQILDYIVTPNFKKGHWYQGIDGGTTALMDAVQGKFKPIVKDSAEEGLSPFQLLIVAFFIFIIISFLFKSGGGGRGGRYDDDDDVILSRRGRRTYPGGFFPFPGSFGGGGFGSGSSGGGFGGFGGGGSFGGGGASGGW
ncbi:TPM domain-containing protein [Kaistella yonginensis]|uniref:TPM domain-containing protein n=1 Tax=Kaistella yonginensis TaxID=658267 RepID=UPI0025B518A3|nr:TPM domain-containing protein [Kaistella yonginensis]MDN3607287.1 TPM domain-containing protein [Kaistella yonginensis]